METDVLYLSASRIASTYAVSVRDLFNALMTSGIRPAHWVDDAPFWRSEDGHRLGQFAVMLKGGAKCQ